MICPVCGGEVPPKPDKRPGPAPKYCSEACRKKATNTRELERWHKKNPKAPYKNQPQKPPLKSCENCGLLFTPVVKGQKYCSLECRQQAYKTAEYKERRNARKREQYAAEHGSKDPATGRRQGKKKHSLDDTLRLLQETGQTYAERQKAETLRLFTHVDF